MSSDRHEPPIEGFLDDGMVKGHRGMLLGAFERAGWPEIERIAAQGVPLSASAYAVVRQRDAHLAQQDRTADRAENDRRHKQTGIEARIGLGLAVIATVVAILAYCAPPQTGTDAGGSPAQAGRSTAPSAHGGASPNYSRAGRSDRHPAQTFEAAGFQRRHGQALRGVQRFSIVRLCPGQVLLRRDVAQEMPPPRLAGLLAGVACRLEGLRPRIQSAVRVSRKQEGFAELGEQQPEAEEEPDRPITAHRLAQQRQALSGSPEWAWAMPSEEATRE